MVAKHLFDIPRPFSVGLSLNTVKAERLTLRDKLPCVFVDAEDARVNGCICKQNFLQCFRWRFLKLDRLNCPLFKRRYHGDAVSILFCSQGNAFSPELLSYN